MDGPREDSMRILCLRLGYGNPVGLWKVAIDIKVYNGGWWQVLGGGGGGKMCHEGTFK